MAEIPTKSEAYDAFARRIVEGRVLTDPWQDGEPRFSEAVERLSGREYREMARAAEDLAAVYDEATALVGDDPDLLDDFLALSPHQKIMWSASEPLWHGIARADIFVTPEGLATSELNCDTPTGSAEAIELARLALQGDPTLSDPCAELGKRFVAMVETMTSRLVDGPYPRTVGLVYPTELTEDLALVRLYRGWLEEAGWEVILGSPYNLGLGEDQRTTLFDHPLGALVRHYKTDWWGERASAWDDDPIVDTLPLVDALRSALTGSVERKTAVINPFGSVVPQNKRTMALMWERIHRFSHASQRTIERHVPFTSRLETMHPAELISERERWVLKSDYGAEGEEVIVGRLVTPEVWEKSLEHASPGRWVAQRHFEPVLREGGVIPNYGVFLVGGEACGLYLRLEAGMTDDHALSVAVMIDSKLG